MAKKQTTAKAAQPSEPGGPRPKGPQVHLWSTQEEYDAQVALPVHRMLKAVFAAEGSEPHYETACGLTLGSQLLRVSDVRGDVTCAKCKASKKR